MPNQSGLESGDVPQGDALGGWRGRVISTAPPWAEVSLATVWFWVFLAVAQLALSPPRDVRFLLPCAAAFAIGTALSVRASFRPASMTFFASNFPSIASWTLVVWIVETAVLSPFGLTYEFLTFILSPVILGVGIAGIWSFRRRPVRALATLGSVAALAAFIAVDTTGLEEAGLRYRVHLVAPVLSRDAEDVLAKPPKDVGRSTDPFKAVSRSGGAVVGWKLGGNVLNTTGLVFDPRRILAKGGTLENPAYSFDGGRCEPIIRDWFVCIIAG